MPVPEQSPNQARASLIAAVHGARKALLSDDEIIEIVEEAAPALCEHCGGSGVHRGANGPVTDDAEIDPCSACNGTGIAEGGA